MAGWFAIVFAISRLPAEGVIMNCFNFEVSVELFGRRIIIIYRYMNLDTEK